MKIRITNGMNRRDVELPMSDSELTLHMKQIGVDESIPQCKLIEVRDKANPLAPFIGQMECIKAHILLQQNTRNPYRGRR